MIILDANVILRYVLGDDEKLSQDAKKAIESNQNYLDEVILAEVIWVLGSVYQLKKDWISKVLSEFVSLPTVLNPRKYLLLTALELYSRENLSYIDCWIYSVSKDLGLSLKTHDKKLKKFASKY